MEDNGSFELANTISQGESVSGTIGESGDVNDYFLSVPENDGTINLQFSFTSTDSNSDFFIYVYNKNGSLLESNFLYNVGIGESNDSVIVYCRQQDSLYFRINSAGILDYTFSYNSIESGSLDSEPNDGFGQAQFFAASDTAEGRIGYASVLADNNDYFLTILPTFGTVTYYLEATNTSGSPSSDFFTYIYNEGGSLIGNSFQYDIDNSEILYDTITIHCRELDTLYFRISSSGCFSYQFRYDVYAPTQNDLEPNATFEEANFFNFNNPVEGRIGSQSVSVDNNDYFFTVLPDDGTLNYYVNYINTSGVSSSDFFTYIYNKNGSLIGSSFQYDQPTGVSLDTITVYCRQADTVFVRISSSGCFSYTFHCEVVPSGEADIEPNENFNQASAFDPAASVLGRVGYNSVVSDNNDYYFSVLPDDGTLNYYVSYNNTSGATSSDFFTYIYNENGSLIGSSFKYNQPVGESLDTITVYCRQADTVYFRISSSGCFSYEFNYEVIPSGEADTEPNGSFNEAISFEPTETVTGRIGYTSVAADANDYYFSVLPEDGTLEYYVTYQNTSGSELSDFFTYIYNKNGSLIGSSFKYNQPLGESLDTITVYCRQADTVYFRISSSGCFSYAFNYSMLNTSVIDEEPNDDFDSATPISLNETLRGQIGHSSVLSDNNDYFSFSVAELSTIALEIYHNNTSGTDASDIFYYLYSESGALVWSEFYYNQQVGLSQLNSEINCLDAGNYSLRITSSGCFSYELDFDIELQQPRADLNYSRFGDTFAFLSNVFRADSVSWDFDDGTTSDLHFPQKQFGIGVYDVTLTAFNEVCNVQDVDEIQLQVNGIESYMPKKAGKGGPVGFFNIQVYGGGLSTATQIELIGSGNVVTPFQIGSPSPAEANFLFSFEGVEPALYDVKIILQSGEEFYFENGFEIFQDQPGFNISTEVSGPSFLRTNRWTSFTLNVHNDRSRIANGVMIGMVLPRDVETNIGDLYEAKTGKYVIKGDEWDEVSLDMEDFENTYFQGSLDRFADSVIIDYDSIYSVVDTTIFVEIDSLFGSPLQGKVYPIYFPFIDSEGTMSLEFKVRSTVNGEIDIITYAWPYNFRNNPMTGETLDFIHEGGMQMAAIAEYAPNPALRFVGRNAGKIDIASKVAFTEFFDWYYGVNNADAEFYAKQTIAVGFEVAGGLAPVDGDKAKASAANYRRRIKNETEHLKILNCTVVPPNTILPGMSERIGKRIQQYRDKIDQLGDFASEADKWAAVQDLQNYLTKRGMNLSQNELNDLIFGPDSKSNEPKEKKKKKVESINSFDPNAIYGNRGYGEQGYINKSEVMNYMVTYENVDTALAPAQVVKIELNLDPQKYNLGSFSLGNITIAEESYFFRDNRISFFREIDLRPAKDMIVRVNARADTVTGDVFWQLSALDPETGRFLNNPLDGFLPPNVNAPEGEGSVSFSVELNQNVAHDDSIATFANIYFDDNEPILTNIWVNRIDTKPPVSELNTQVVLLNDTTMQLSYSGSDQGSGVESYYLKVRVNNDAWLTPDFPMTSAGTFDIIGTQGNTYFFNVFARDSAGNVESVGPGVQAFFPLIPPDSNIDPDFSIYPNPTRGQLFVKSNGNFDNTIVSIYDMYGKRVSYTRSSFIENQERLYLLPDLAQGVYLIRFENQAGKVVSKRFVVSPNEK